MKVDRKKQDLWFITFDYLYCVQCDFFFFFLLIYPVFCDWMVPNGEIGNQNSWFS